MTLDAAAGVLRRRSVRGTGAFMRRPHWPEAQRVTWKAGVLTISNRHGCEGPWLPCQDSREAGDFEVVRRNAVYSPSQR